MYLYLTKNVSFFIFKNLYFDLVKTYFDIHIQFIHQIKMAASDWKSVESPLIWRRRKHFWPKIRFDSGSGSKIF